ncbi:hypothetical protein N836_15715 [Leptolyngbya sp. Heron Island J]|uniref:hypothetical protein n=1 Tax=Leptolyngbya sp. Heron Island J TaxID=1385935 RepID=UPI0003B99E70|nr:hypothetical protein [Leptolyngbya sp. Heron Island J]ESA34862.1 hypothetical protein N836_15715 [Leptolyngbya sp. Heron Island J]
MFGTRNFLVSVHDPDKKHTDEIDIKRLLRQTKQISQIIAYTWLDEDKDVCKNLDDCFKDPKRLKKLLYAYDASSNEYKWLEKVFKDQEGPSLPIFSRDEIDSDIYEFKVLHSQFEGKITDADPGSKSILTMWIPYPPCPQISDKPNEPGEAIAPIYKGDLEEWIKDPSDEKPYYAKNPYIPTTCS